jgi:hypothetical protein
MSISLNFFFFFLFFQGVEVRNGCPTRAVYHKGELLSVTRTAPGPPRPQGHPQPGVSLNPTPYIWVGVGVSPHTLDPKKKKSPLPPARTPWRVTIPHMCH